MYFSEPSPEWNPGPVPFAVSVVMVVTTFATVYLGLFPDVVRDFALRSANALR